MSKARLTISFYLWFFTQSIAQVTLPNPGVIYNDDIVPRIDIQISSDTLAFILSNVQSTVEHKATFYWNDGLNKDTIENVGFRLRGNTSRQSAKKSFKIDFTHFGSKKFHGVSDLNLNGEHNDPSIMRAKLTWNIMRMAGIEGPRSNHVRLYINNEYRGLYLNVEHIDDDYLEKRNKDPKGQLFKCNYGADFVYLGPNPAFYQTQAYEYQNNNDEPDYYTLMLFIKALDDINNPDFKCNLEAIFDVDNYLKRMAIEVLVGHWDNPIYNKNNAYLYFNPKTNKFELLSYDTDNTFGIDWLGIDWATRNIYSWSNSQAKRPIFTNLLTVQEYKKRYGYYIDLYTKTIFNPNALDLPIESLFYKLKNYRVNDYYASLDYGYTYDDFEKSINTSLSNHVKYGIKEYIQARSTTAKQQLQNITILPVIENVRNTWTNTSCLTIFDAWYPQAITIVGHYKLGNESWKEVTLRDDGIFPDKIANDRQYALQFDYDQKVKAQMYFEAKIDESKVSRWPVCDYYEIELGYNPTPLLKINEIMASNNTISDEYGEKDDWIEIYNSDANPVFLGDYFLSDARSKRDKWRMPNVDIAPGEFVLIWADEQQEQGERHANFKLDKSGEFIGIFDNEFNAFSPIDTFRFGAVDTDKTIGRYPNGQGDIVDLTSPTPGASNVTVNTDNSEIKLSLSPNPVLDLLTLCFDSNTKTNKPIECIHFIDLNGIITSPIFHQNGTCVEIDVNTFASGFYVLELCVGNKTLRYKVVKM
jgi:spore coat protein CotH